jgi:D-alanine-D-alanine ligase
MSKIKIGLIFGGKSEEHDISIISAKSIYDNLNKDKYKIYSYYIDKTGKWSMVESPYNTDNLKEVSQPFFPFKNIKPLIEKVDLFFPILHGKYGEDGTIQGIFEFENIPFVGSGTLGSSVGMNKIISKKILESEGIPVVDYIYISKNEINNLNEKELINSIEEGLGYPLFVKPSNSGSSFGITKVKNPDSIYPALQKAVKYSDNILIEEAVNAREIECAVFSNKKEIKASILGEIIPFNDFYDYEDKYVLNKTQFNIPANIDYNLSEKIRKTAMETFKSLNQYGMARVDFLLDKNNNEFFVNEINSIPGFTSISMYPRLWKETGLNFSELLDKLIESGLMRYE